ncbi:Adam Eukaryotic translation initiation factor 3 subunit J [Nymphaea thermarum]|nr:Adam Eukaryotic translation initiation factor 3 subunit J [Nymphaea thermarum]
MDDWESDDFDPALPVHATGKPKGLWDDEDIEDVKVCWEDGDVPPLGKAPVPEPPIHKALTNAGGKIANHKKQTSMAAVEERHTDPLEEKLRQQRLVEEADYKSTMELFDQTSDKRTLDNVTPKSLSEFLEYAELNNFHYRNLLKAIMRLSMAPMKAADAKEVLSSMTAIVNEKLKVEKEAASKKKPTKKKQLNMDAADDDAVVAYEELDDYEYT